MKKSATDVMQEIVFSAVIDGIVALKAASKGMPNTLLRDLNTVHPNTTFADLPKELQAAIGESVRLAFGRLRKEGYTVAASSEVTPQRSAPMRPRPPEGGRPPRSGPPRQRPDGNGRPPRNGPRGRGPGPQR